jgi:hypothetical protein
MATLVGADARDLSFWQRMTLGLALFIVFGFLQFAARGFVDYQAVPFYVHLHAVVMVSWLALMVVQPMLVQHGNAALHRRLGWLGAVLAAAIVVVCSLVSLWIVRAGRQPPFFTPPYFLAMTQLDALAFGGLVAAAIVRRRETEWHRRLLVGALVLLMDPALGRLLPMPLIMPYGGWAVLAVQLAVLGIVMRHDRRTMGAIHPATLYAAIVVTFCHCLVELMAISPIWQAWAGRIIAA